MFPPPRRRRPVVGEAVNAIAHAVKNGMLETAAHVTASAVARNPSVDMDTEVEPSGTVRMQARSNLRHTGGVAGPQQQP
eukprot:5879545-Prymnesium_polylepis.1